MKHHRFYLISSLKVLTALCKIAILFYVEKFQVQNEVVYKALMKSCS